MTLYSTAAVSPHPARDIRVMISASDKSRCLAYSPVPVIRQRLTLFDPANTIEFAYFTSYAIVVVLLEKTVNIYFNLFLIIGVIKLVK